MHSRIDFETPHVLSIVVQIVERRSPLPLGDNDLATVSLASIEGEAFC